mmetsp:Transcript_3565/g.6905  ORF Transcript_3565/g.6905 Transcript_3565/m.6905 type:complete len:88 (+) Transcript_3565:4180-4443(+)
MHSCMQQQQRTCSCCLRLRCELLGVSQRATRILRSKRRENCRTVRPRERKIKMNEKPRARGGGGPPAAAARSGGDLILSGYRGKEPP